MARKIQIKRGAKADLPVLSQGEFGMCVDSNAEELHIGTGAKNIQIPMVGVYYDDMNDLVRSGIYRVGTQDSLPEGLWYGQVLVMQGADSDTVCQIGMGYTDDAIYARSGQKLSDGTYQWRTWKSTAEPANAVAKAGDTMTGVLNMGNTADYIGVQKIRSISDALYYHVFGIGSDTTKGASGSLRLTDGDGTVLGRLDLWADGTITHKVGSGAYTALARVTWGTADISAGTASSEPDGTIHVIYEP